MKYNELYPNWKLETRQDLADVFAHLTAPLKPYYSEGCALVSVDGAGYSATKMACCVEGFSRVLWGLAPLLAGGFESEWLATYQTGLRNGTDPEHPEYWGEVDDCDQRLVEMAAISYALLLRPDLFWQPLSKQEQDNLYAWLNQINTRKVVDNNWSFFRVLVDLAFDSLGLPYDEAIFKTTMVRIESFYRADGWYKDGETGTYDYYNDWAFQFYSMVYYKHRKEKEPARCERFKSRIIEHAQQLKVWFADGGAAIPMGRSLIYRFAQASFFGALAYIDLEAIPWGECKHIVLQNYRYWLSQDIFDRDGVLALGYTYPNVFMTEDYNSTTSAYWSYKGFIPLALPENHPFWLAEETPLSYPAVTVQKAPGFLVQRMEQDDHVVLLSGKQYRWTDCNYFFSNFADKYGKFAYSTKYGFSIARGANAASQGAFDSTLALCEQGDDYYRVRAKQKLISITEQAMISEWSPWSDVVIRTLVVPFEGWHLRVHKIDSARALHSIEGGFCLRKSDVLAENQCEEASQYALARSVNGTSVVRNLSQSRKGTVVHPEANTNVLMCKTLLPSLIGTVEKGVSWHACAVFAGEESGYVAQQLAHTFRMERQGGQLSIFAGDVCLFNGAI